MMTCRNIAYRLLIVLTCMLCFAQLFGQSAPVSASCNNATGICTGSSYSFPASVNAPSAEPGADYGCLRTQPNPAWFFMRIKNAGRITIRMSSSPARDIDFVLWGPFTSPTAPCVTGLVASKIVDCSYSTAAVETADIPNAVAGGYYLMLITNYSNRNTDITFSQTGGTGTSDCDVLCNITGITAQASSCDAVTKGTYTLTGTVSVFSPPSSGTLTITSSCGKSVTYQAPFSTSIAYTIPGITGKGDSCMVTAAFSAVGTCSRSAFYAAPSCCSLTVTSPLSACAGQQLQLEASGTAGGSFYWSGPASFTSNTANPVINPATSAQAGNYRVFLTNGNCTTSVKTAVVSIRPGPDTSVSVAGSTGFCAGDSVTLTAANIPGVAYQWQSGQAIVPGAVSRSFTVKNSGTYRVQLTGTNGCSAYSAARSITAYAYPDTTLSVTGPLTICSGQSVLLEVPHDTSATYTWHHNSDVLDVGVHRLEATLGGLYKVEVSRNNCRRTSSPVQVNLVPKPASSGIRHK